MGLSGLKSWRQLMAQLFKKLQYCTLVN